MMYMDTKEAAQKWGYSEDAIRRWCREGKIYLEAVAIKKNGRWQIPKDAECPKPIRAK